jgi:poly-beta-1,6-N-acetyl-D-glucosamine synthase
MTAGARVLLVTPTRDEASHIERTARALAAQTRRPDLWLVADDGSQDATPRLLEGLAGELPFLRVLHVDQNGNRNGSDGLALAAEARAFNRALAGIDLRWFTHIGKLDGDIELAPDYLERLLARFAAEPELGVGGGTLLEPDPAGWRTARVPEYHVRGALKLYTRECFEAIGGIEERLGWDTIDETYARMRGFSTRSFEDLPARHHRPLATANGVLRGRARHGRCAYILHYGPGWVALRSLKVAASRPRGLSGAAFLLGYLGAWARREPQVEDQDFRRFVRGELRKRLKARRSSPLMAR